MKRAGSTISRARQGKSKRALVYGGLFWVNGTDRWNLPRETFYMAGAGGQWTVIVPSHDLVIVRMGHRIGARAGEGALNRAIDKLIETIPAEACARENHNHS